MQKNVFISLDGVDGVGKTTVALLLAEQGFQYYKSPSGAFAELRKEIDLRANPLERYCFYMMAVQYDTKHITDLLKHGPVVADRYVATTAAYHYVLDERVKLIHSDTHLLQPDYAFHLNCGSKIRDQRIVSRKRNISDSILENNSPFLDQVNEVFLSFNLIYIDTGVVTALETVELIKKHIYGRVNA